MPLGQSAAIGGGISDSCWHCEGDVYSESVQHLKKLSCANGILAAFKFYHEEAAAISGLGKLKLQYAMLLPDLRDKFANIINASHTNIILPNITD